MSTGKLKPINFRKIRREITACNCFFNATIDGHALGSKWQINEWTFDLNFHTLDLLKIRHWSGLLLTKWVERGMISLSKMKNQKH